MLPGFDVANSNDQIPTRQIDRNWIERVCFLNISFCWLSKNKMVEAERSWQRHIDWDHHFNIELDENKFRVEKKTSREENRLFSRFIILCSSDVRQERESFILIYFPSDHEYMKWLDTEQQRRSVQRVNLSWSRFCYFVEILHEKIVNTRLEWREQFVGFESTSEIDLFDSRSDFVVRARWIEWRRTVFRPTTEHFDDNLRHEDTWPPF